MKYVLFKKGIDGVLDLCNQYLNGVDILYELNDKNESWRNIDLQEGQFHILLLKQNEEYYFLLGDNKEEIIDFKQYLF